MKRENLAKYAIIAVFFIELHMFVWAVEHHHIIHAVLSLCIGWYALYAAATFESRS